MSDPVKNLLLTCWLLFSATLGLADGVELGEFSVSATLPELVGAESASRFEGVVAADEPIEWQVYVPESYDPEVPAGMLVFISPTDSGRIPEGYKDVMDAHNLIWIGANQSGNRIRVARRVTYAMFAPAAVARDYQVDASRVYVSGFSGGGRVASMVAPEYPHVFKGAIFICGVNFWGSRKPAELETVQANRYVFLTGRKDFNRSETRTVHRSYRKAGAKNVLLMEISGMDHRMPPVPKLVEAIEFLDRH
jgi:dienelactone hydrolase